MTAPQYETYDDADRLKELYWDAGMTQKEIANLYGVSHAAIGRAMRRNGVPTRYSGGQYSKVANYATGKNGYERWDTDDETIYVHQLVAIADGEDPSEVFSDECVVHHKNRQTWDNRPENLDVVTHKEHAQIHSEDRKYRKYTEEELVEWINSFVEVVGVVPTASEMRDAPGPCPQTYEKYFGSWRTAVRQAGHSPRGVGE